MANINKTCVDCGLPFLFTDSEQAFFKSYNYPDPKRCAVCRKAKKAAWGDAKHPSNGECFDCNERLVRGVITDASRHCIKCGREIPEKGIQFAVIR